MLARYVRILRDLAEIPLDEYRSDPRNFGSAEVLGKEAVLDAGFAASLEPMAWMRNRLVHHYEDVEPARVHELLQTHLDDFDQFARAIAEHLATLENDR